MESEISVSVVIPVFRNAHTVEPLHGELTRVLQRFGSYEILFVDDACPADSLSPLRRIAAADPRVGVLALGRNRGQNRALLTGLAHVRGERIVLMDADLQDPPAAIPELVATLDRGFGAVFAGRRGAYEGKGRLWSSRLFKAAVHRLTGGRVPTDAGLYVALSPEMRHRVLAIHDPRPYLIELMGRSGLTLRSIPVERRRTEAGESAYTPAGRIRIGLAAVTAPVRRRFGRKGRGDAWTGEIVERIGWVEHEEPFG